MKCPYCGMEHPDYAKFCPSTGKPIQLDNSFQTDQLSDNQVIKSVSRSEPEEPFQGSVEESRKPDVDRKEKKKWPLWITLAIAFFVVSGIIIVLTVIFINYFGFSLDNFPFLQTRQSASDVDLISEPTTTQTASPVAQATEFLSPTNQVLPTKAGFEEDEADQTDIDQLEADSTSTPEALVSVTETSLPSIAVLDIELNSKDQAEMVFIPAGEFTMGSDPEKDSYFWGAEGPSHQVYLDGYWIYRYEVTNKMYQDCVSAGACPRPEQTKSRTRPDYFSNPDYADYPVIYVNYTAALSYCRWVGGRLPTEAEWERAARGDADTRLFPWGYDPANEVQANFCDQACPENDRTSGVDDGYRETAPIGSYPDGISPYGLYDTAGNVWEWVLDNFSPTYYQISPEKNPLGVQSSKYRVIRGGGWSNPSSGVRIVQRTGVRPDISLDTLGFRCMVEAEQ